MTEKKRMKWTKSQLRVISKRNSNILVSAAAGSGKTAVLVERIIRLVRDEGENIDNFLIVTFTNAAANGMKQKIQKALVDAIESGEGDRKHLRNQLSLLNKAQISTIHSFCMDVVRKNFHIVGVDPNFRIGDTNECNILINECIDEILEEAYTEKSADFIKLVESFTGNRSDKELVELIKDMYYFSLSFPKPLEWLRKSVDELNLTEEELVDSEWVKCIKGNIEILLEEAGTLIENSLGLCREEDGPMIYSDAINGDKLNVDDLTDSLNINFEEFIDKLYELKHPKLATLRGKAKDACDIDKVDEVKANRDEYKKIIDNIKKLIPDKPMSQFAEDINYMYPAMNALYSLVEKLFEVFSAKKLEKSILDFSDVEHYALEILSQEDISYVYRNKFDYIFVDEYQDSNQLQETLLSCIKRNNNMFMVGDVKQSIYKFRLADPELFMHKFDTYDAVGDDSIDTRIDLNQNFRSRAEILNGTNYIFQKIMSKKLGELEYNESVFLNPGTEFKPTGSDEIELNIIESKVDEDDELDEELMGMKTAELEARFAVDRIRRLIGTQTYDPKDEILRPIEYKDIVILLRSVSNWSTVFEEVFFEEGIPFYSDAGSGYFETIEIQIIVNLLKLIDNFRQDIPLLSIMRSPIGKFTTEELIRIRVNAPKLSFVDALFEYTKIKDDLSDKINTFVKMIENYKKKSRYVKLNDLIWDVLINTNYYYFVGALPNGRMRQANLRILTDKAYDYEKTSMTGLFNFLKYIEKLKTTTTDESTAKILSENDNVVRLMTIHKSKGLEFPVVLLCGLNKKFNMMDTTKPILKHKVYGLAPKYINPEQRIYRQTLPQVAMKNVIKLETLSEEMRVLYVALTRAVDKLILVGTVKSLESKAKRWKKGTTHYNIYSAESYLDWICSAIFYHRDCRKLRELAGYDDTSIKADELGSRWLIEFSYLSDIGKSINSENTDREERIKQIEEFTENDNSSYVDEIKRRLGFEYRYKNSVNVPSKLSVTDLKTLENEEGKTAENVRMVIPTLRDIPAFKQKKKDFTAAEIGTITHFVMQHIKLCNQLSTDEIKSQVNEMVTRRLLTEEEADVVNIERINIFFSTPIGQRMLKSSNVKREIPFVIKKRASDIIKTIESDDVILIQGIIDCYFYEGDEIVIIDYKTDSLEFKTIDDIKSRYAVQILAYKEALENITNVKVKECYLYLFDNDMQLEIK